jgi:hypothetical protein
MKRKIHTLLMLLLVMPVLTFAQFGPNIVVNGNFGTGELAPWSTYLADFAGARATFTIADNKASITGINTNGSDSWHIQLNQVLTPAQIAQLEVGKTYQVRFDADAVSARTVNVFLGQDGGSFTALALETISLPAGQSTQSFNVTVGATFATMKLGFEFGLSSVAVSITNVYLRETTEGGGGTPSPVMPRDFILFAAGGKHISIPAIPQGDVVNDAAISDKPVLRFNNGNWTIGGFDWGSQGIDVSSRRAQQDSIYIRIWSSPNNHSDARGTSGNNTAKIHFLDIAPSGQGILEFRVQLALPDEVHVGQWMNIAVPLPAFLTKAELNAAKTAGTLTGYAALWDYWGAYSPAREQVIDSIEDVDWREFNWERVRRFGIYWDQAPPPNAPVYIEHIYVGRSGLDLSIANQGPTTMGAVSATHDGTVNTLSWSGTDDIFSYGVYYSDRPITSTDDPNARLWAVLPASVTSIEHPVYRPHPGAGDQTYYYALSPGNAWGVLAKDVASNAVAVTARGQDKGYIFQLTAAEETGVFNALDRGEFPGINSFPKDQFSPVALRYPGAPNDFWTGPSDLQGDVWVAYGTADNFTTLFFYGEILDDNVLGGPVNNPTEMSGTTIYPKIAGTDPTWVPGVASFDSNLEWNYYLKDQLVVEFGAYTTDSYVSGSLNRFRTRGATPEYSLAFQPYFENTGGGVNITTTDPNKLLVRLWMTEPSGRSDVDYNSLYYNSRQPLTTPAVYENLYDNANKRIGWRFFAAIDSQDLLSLTAGGQPVDTEMVLPAADQLKYMPMTMLLWDKDGGPAPGNWWESATNLIMFPTKPWGFSGAINSSDISGMGTLAIAGRAVSTSVESPSEMPQQAELFQNYPNPFNPTTNIEFQIPDVANVSLTVYNSIGQRVAVLANSQIFSPGRHTLSFDARALSSGVYIYRLEAGNQIIQRKMVLVK